jgi:hypothetical protein
MEGRSRSLGGKGSGYPAHSCVGLPEEPDDGDAWGDDEHRAGEIGLIGRRQHGVAPVPPLSRCPVLKWKSPHRGEARAEFWTCG